MMKLKTWKILCHVIAWTVYFAWEFFGYFDRLNKYTLLGWYEVAYNCFSLIPATYICFALALKFWEKIPSYNEFLEFSATEKRRVLINTYLLGIVAVIGVYTALSFWLDNEFFGLGGRDIILQLKARANKLVSLAAIAVVYAYHVTHRRKANQKIEIANWRVKIYQNVTDYLKTLLEKINVN